MTSETIHTAHSPAVQDYLRAIYQLACEGASGTSAPDGRVTTSHLAERLDVRPASVTAMLQKLAAASPALVDYHKNYGARLTTEGELAALRVVRFHRLLELYLHEVLGFEWHEVHEEADRLEHAVSEAMIDRMAETLGHPAHDPHGHAIPAADLSFDPPATIPLRDLAVGEPAVVRHVSDEDPELLRYLDAISLRPGANVILLPGREPRLQIEDEAPLVLDQAIARRVFVGSPASHASPALDEDIESDNISEVIHS